MPDLMLLQSEIQTWDMVRPGMVEWLFTRLRRLSHMRQTAQAGNYGSI